MCTKNDQVYKDEKLKLKVQIQDGLIYIMN